jgi:cyclopropane fatty-acyl-phospholipid synthase-like methyltransferase
LKKDIRYVPTPPLVVEAMLDLAKITPDDRLYDLGSGDGRLVLAAAARGTRSVGIDIDPSLVLRSQNSAREANLTHLAEFRCANLFSTDLSGVTVLTLYLREHINIALLPKLRAELAPGTRIVSHSFSMGDWEPLQRIEVDAKFVYLWILN